MKTPAIASPAIKIAVTSFLLLVVFRSVDAARIRQNLAHLATGHLALLVAVSWLGQLFCAQRWRVLACSLGMRQGYGTFFQYYFVGMLFNLGLPSLVGGDVIKAYMISRKTGSPVHYGLASVLQDRAAGLISLLVLGTTAAALHAMEWRGVPVRLVYLAVWIGVASALGMAWKGERIYRKYIIPGSHSLIQKALAALRDFHEALGTMRLETGAVLQVAGISFFNSALVLWLFRQVSVAAGYPVDAIAFAALFPLITLMTLIPISLGGIGVREWTYLQALAILNVPPDAALTIALASSALVVVSDLAGAFFLPVIPSGFRSKS